MKLEITRLILERFGQVDAIAGVATGAIPQGALVADALNLPFVYVRSTPKDHGLENLVEGELRPGMKVVVVEDLISTGGSSLKAVEAIRRDGCVSDRYGCCLHLWVSCCREGIQRSKGSFGDIDQLRSRNGSCAPYRLYRRRRCGYVG